MSQDFLSIYIHWPFCLSKCPYCDFNSHALQQIDHNIWLQSYEKEIEYFKEIIQAKYIKSIFFGGGTPSLMQPFVVEKLIDKINQLATIDTNTEITLETNPTSFETNKFYSFKLAGVNRVSIGVQSLREHDLKKLGRTHDTKQAIKTITLAYKIFSKISFDLIYARSGQTLKEWQDELQEAIKLTSGHISLYQLTIEKGTLFYKLFKENKLKIPNSDIAAEMYEWTNYFLNSNKYSQYEISNYSTPGQECLHNLAYWNYDSYLGIGPGAHSRIIEKESPTPIVHSIMMWHSPQKWLKTVNEQKIGIQTRSKLSKQEIILEVLMMGLRLSEGINIDILEKKLAMKLSDILDFSKTQHYQNLGLLRLDKNIYLTDKGLMMHNYIVPRIIK